MKLFSSRIDHLRKEVFGEASSADTPTSALLISNQVHVTYFSGFPLHTLNERDAWILIGTDFEIFITDSRYLGTTPEGWDTKIISPDQPLRKILTDAISTHEIKTLYFESENLSHLEYSMISQHVKIPCEPLAYKTSRPRMKKDAQEVSSISKACKCIMDCLEELRPSIHDGMTEKGIENTLLSIIRRSGAEPAFDPIIAFNANSAIPHYMTGSNDSPLKIGDIVLIDCGARIDGYNSDVSRTFCFSGKPAQLDQNHNSQSPEFSRVYKVVKDAYSLAVKLSTPGTPYKEIDTKVREFISTQGFEPYKHALGHGIGLEVHEHPHISLRSEDVVEEGHVITIEPGIYLAGKFGIRYENTLVIT